jgi:membrane-bound acyltransferase YfiQ involved in biofilm formation
MKRNLYFWQGAGFLFTGIFGTLLHFIFDWSNGNRFAALFSGVNESVWEHMKLLFFPMFLVAVLENCFLGKKYENFMTVKLRGIILGSVLIPMIYYTYIDALGVSADWFNISIFFIANAAGYIYESKLIIKDKKTLLSSTASIVILFILAGVYFVFTFYPPHIPLFQDPVTGIYGIS